jgi:predicted O-methyltransferase YrrM
MISSNLNEKINAIAKILDNIGERVEGNLICDISSSNSVMEKNIGKIHNLQTLAKGKNTICEIGVNAGHSLLIMLEQNPTADYTLFDLGNHKYTRPCLDYIKSVYPNTKINIIYGDSLKTLPKFISNNLDTKFELIHIDGGHKTQVVEGDFNHCKQMLDKEGITIFDDYNYEHIKTFLDQKVKNEEIIECQNEELHPTERHFIYNLNPI